MTVFFLSNSKDEAKNLLLRVLHMIVPKNKISLGYKLRPRFIAYADSDFLDVAAVLMKMKNKMEDEEGYI